MAIINKFEEGKYNNLFRQLLFIGILIVVGFIIFDRLRFFTGSALGAITLYVVFRKTLFNLIERRNWKKWVASLTLVLLIAFLVLLGGYFLIKMMADEIVTFDTSRVVAKVNESIDHINKKMGFQVISDDTISGAGGYIAKAVLGLLNTTYSFVMNVLLMLLILFFMFISGRKMECSIYRYVPFKGRSLSLLRCEVKNMIFSSAVGVPLILIGQTLAASLIYWVLGIADPILLGFLTGLCGLVPVIGSGLTYIPVAIYLLVAGNVLGGIIVILYGILVISGIDNVIRIVVMDKYSDTHPLIVIFGLILGLPLFGFWGIVFGPLLISGFLLLIKIYFVEYGLLSSYEEAMSMAYSENEPHPEARKPDKGLHKLHAVRAVRAVKSIGKNKPPEKSNSK